MCPHRHSKCQPAAQFPLWGKLRYCNSDLGHITIPVSRGVLCILHIDPPLIPAFRKATGCLSDWKTDQLYQLPEENRDRFLFSHSFWSFSLCDTANLYSQSELVTLRQFQTVFRSSMQRSCCQLIKTLWQSWRVGAGNYENSTAHCLCAIKPLQPASNHPLAQLQGRSMSKGQNLSLEFGLRLKTNPTWAITSAS